MFCFGLVFFKALLARAAEDLTRSLARVWIFKQHVVRDSANMVIVPLHLGNAFPRKHEKEVCLEDQVNWTSKQTAHLLSYNAS